MSVYQMTGGWSSPEPPTSHDNEIFVKAFGSLSGLSYEPHLVSRQVVRGTNYAFYCGVNAATSPPQTGFVISEAHESLEGAVSRTTVTLYGMIPQSLNEWSEPRLLDDNDIAVFEKGVKGVTGVVHTPLLVSSQLAQGKNYRYFCTSKTETNTGISVFTIHEKEQESVAEPRITNVATFG